MAMPDRIGTDTMSWTIEWDAELDVVRVVLTGTFSLDGFRDMTTDVLSQPFWRPGTDALFDYRDCIVNQHFTDVFSVASDHALRSAEIGDGKVALVLGSKSSYGNARQYQSLAEGLADSQIRPFLELNEAEAWLRGDID